MMLVNIHKPFLLLLLLLTGTPSANAQVWSLQQCIDTAHVYNRNILINRNNINIGTERERETKANLIPKLTAHVDYKYFIALPYQLMPLSTFNPTAPEGQFKEAQFGVPHNINANLQLAMPLYNPQVYGAIQTAKIATELSKLQYEKTEEQVFFEIANLYYNAQLLKHQMWFIDSNLINAGRLLKNIQLLNEHSLAKGTDVSKVKLQMLQLETQKQGAGSKYKQILNALKLAMGMAIEQNLEIDASIQYLPSNEYTPSSTLDGQIIKKQNRLLSSELSTLKKSRFLPSLSLVGMYGTSGFGYDKQPNDFLKFYPMGFAGVQLSYPLFNGTVTQRKINQKRIELRNNELQSEFIAEQNNMQVENAKLQRMVAEKTVETTTEQMELAKSIYHQTVAQQGQGTANLADVLLADNALREAQQTYLTAVTDYLKADLELKKLTGNFTTTK